MYRYVFLFAVFVIGCCDWARAQNPQPIFRNFTTDNGLPSSETYVVFQDSKDYIWIATDNGVSRFDGYGFRNFSSKDGLLDPVVFHLQEDRKGRVWMSTLANDVYFYEAGKIHAFPYNHIIQKHHSSEEITSRNFYVAEDGTFYSNISNTGILEIKTDGTFQLLRPKVQGSSFILEIESHAFYQNTRVPKKLREAFYRKYREKGILPDLEIHKDSVQIIKGIKNDYGVYRFTSGLIKTNQQEYLMFHSGYLSKIKDGVLKWTIDYPKRLTQNGLFAEPNGQVFLGAINGEGVFQYDDMKALQNGRARHFLDGYSVTSVLKDRKGGYWFSTLEQGVFYTPAFNLLVYDRRMGLPGDLIKGVSVKDEDSFWISLRNGGVFSIDIVQNKLARMPDAPFDEENWDLRFDRQRNVLWKGGNYLSYWENGAWKDILFPGQNSNSQSKREGGNKRINFSKDGRFLWGADRLGFIKVDLKTKKIVDDSRQWNIRDRTFVVFEDLSARVWIGSVNGLFEYKEQQLHSPFEHPALKLRIEDIGQLRDSTLVIGTKGEGILLMKGDSIQAIGEVQGLSSNMIENIFVDQYNQIWVGTLVGLNRIRVNHHGQPEILQITRAHGLPSNEINKVRALGEHLLIATSRGLAYMLFQTKDTISSPPILSDLVINNDTQKIEQDLSLEYNQNNLELHFYTIDFEQAGQIEYRYRLNPLNKEWVQTTSQGFANMALPPNEYMFEVQSKNKDGLWSTSTQFQFEILPPFWQRWWFVLLLLSSIIGLVWCFYRIRLGQVRRENETKLRFFDLERAALRAQMNPHFIFNVLSSIQFFILNDEKKAANRYLSRFARLVRATLNHSRQSKITLENEIQILETYLDLEKMRFKDQFQYHIEVDPDLINQDIKLPPMLIQPYLENALIHGLAPKKQEGFIEVSYQLEGHYLNVTIRDNGIGITRSKALKEKEGKTYESVGMHITKQRLEMMNNGDRKQIVNVVELKNELGMVAGTKVDIWIELQELVA